jgi:uncharacterized cofD-like protein
MKKIVVIGGGTGTSVVLSGLKKYNDLDISVIVNMTDDGGSNAVVRDEFGVLPLSDLRKSIIALADENYNDILRKLFVYRFHEGNGLSGHTLGNLLMLAAVDIYGSEEKAVKMFEDLFDTKGKIVPVTADDVRLVAEYKDGKKVVGEHLIDEICEDRKIEKFGLDSPARISNEAKDEILNADYIVIGPGDIYTSILACIVVNGMAETIQRSKGNIVFVGNLMSKIGQTRGMSHQDIVSLEEEYIGRKIDHILINNGNISEELIQKYKDDGEDLIEDDLSNDRRVIRKDIIANTEYIKDKGDTLKRSLVRHDPDKLGSILYELFEGKVRGFFLNMISRFY